MSTPRKRTEPPVGSSSRTSAADQGRLAAARLADDAERLALVQLEGDVRRRRCTVPVRPAEQAAAADREVDLQVLGLEQRRARSRHARHHVRRAARPNCPSTRRRGRLLVRLEPAAVEVLGCVRELRAQRRHLGALGERVRAARAEVAARPAGSAATAASRGSPAAGASGRRRSA